MRQALFAYRVPAACAAACTLACIGACLFLVLPEPTTGAVGMRICALAIIVSSVVFVASALPEGVIDMWSVSRTYLYIACGIAACGAAVLYAVATAALQQLPTPHPAIALALVPIGIAIACCACMLWLRASFATFVGKQTHAFVDTANRALRDSCDKALARKDGPLLMEDLEPYDEAAHTKKLCAKGAGCAIALSTGVALALGSPAPSGIVPPSLAVGCAAACSLVVALYGIYTTRIAQRYQNDLDNIRTDVDRKLDVARAEYAAHTARIMASEATSAAAQAHLKALEANTKPALEDACQLAREKFALSQREYEVLKQLAAGRSRPRIASDMRITISTVNTHVQNIYRKLEVHNSQKMLDVLESLR